MGYFTGCSFYSRYTNFAVPEIRKKINIISHKRELFRDYDKICFIIYIININVNHLINNVGVLFLMCSLMK